MEIKEFKDHEPLKVMIVDDNMTCLQIALKLFSRCEFQVLPFQSAAEALYALHESNGQKADLILIEIHVGSTKFASLTGSKFLEIVKKEKKNLPIFTMCAHNNEHQDPEEHQFFRCDFFHISKPITDQAIEMLRKKTLLKKAKNTKNEVPESSKRSRKETVNPNQNVVGLRRKVKAISFASNHDRKSTGDLKSKGENGGRKKLKGRLSWNLDLHNRFLIALQVLGKYASPQRIHEIMNVEGLSVKHVASHLQKHRLRVEKIMKKAIMSSKNPALLPEITQRNSLPIKTTFALNVDNLPSVVKSPLTININQPKPDFSEFVHSNYLKQHFEYFNKSINHVLMNELPSSSDGGNGLWGLTWKRVDETEIRVSKEDQVMVQNSMDRDDKDAIIAMNNMFNEIDSIDINQLLKEIGDDTYQLKEDCWFNLEELCKSDNKANDGENLCENAFPDLPAGKNLSGNAFLEISQELDNGNSSLVNKEGEKRLDMDEVSLMDYEL